MARLSEGAKALGIRIEQPSSGATPRYRVKDVFTTYNGSWEVGDHDPPYGIEQWARDAYLSSNFDDAGADHHLFGMLMAKGGTVLTGANFKFGTPQWGDDNDALIPAKRHSGWANIALYPSSSFSPERGERGAWAWHPFGMNAEIVSGGGLPNRHHISTFAVWQEVDGDTVTPPVDGDIEDRLAAVEAELESMRKWAEGMAYRQQGVARVLEPVTRPVFSVDSDN